VDRIIELGYSTKDSAEVCFKRIFKQDPCKRFDDEAIDRYAEAFKNHFPLETRITTAELSQYCMNYRGEPVKAVQEFDEYLRARRTGEATFRYEIRNSEEVHYNEDEDMPGYYDPELLHMAPGDILHVQQPTEAKRVLTPEKQKAAWSSYLHFRAWKGKSVTDRNWSSEDPSTSDLISTPDADDEDESLWKSFPFAHRKAPPESSTQNSGFEATSDTNFTVDGTDDDKSAWLSGCLPFLTSQNTKPQAARPNESYLRETMIYPVAKKPTTTNNETAASSDSVESPLETLHLLQADPYPMNDQKEQSKEEERVVWPWERPKSCKSIEEGPAECLRDLSPTYATESGELDGETSASSLAERIVEEELERTVGEQEEESLYSGLKELIHGTSIRAEPSFSSVSQCTSVAKQGDAIPRSYKENDEIRESDKTEAQIPESNKKEDETSESEDEDDDVFVLAREYQVDSE
jgi:hypothetical protein